MPKNYSVLYYPTIEFQDDMWIKTNLLLWDHIYRIVPRGYTPKDNRNISVCTDNDIIRPIYLEKGDLLSASDGFIEFYKSLKYIPEGLKDKQVDRLHKDKIDDRLYPIIEKYSQHYDPEGFYHIDRGLSRGYMFYLANSVSQRRNFEMVTDNSDAWTVMSFFSEQGNFSHYFWDDNNADCFYTSLIFSDILPKSVENVDIDKIVTFVQQRKDERRRLVSTISSFAHQMSNCESKDHLETIRNDFHKDITQAKNDYKKSCGFSWENLGSSLLTIGIPAGLTLFSELTKSGNTYSIDPLIPSVCYCAIAALMDSKKARNKSKASNYSYLVEIDKKLSKSQNKPQLKQIFKEFMND